MGKVGKGLRERTWSEMKPTRKNVETRADGRPPQGGCEREP